MFREKNPEILLARLSACTDDGEKVHILYELGETGDRSAEKRVAEFLTSPDADLRYVALRVLILDWRLEEYAGVAARFLLSDPDHYNRMLAAACIGALFRNSGDPQSCFALLRAFSNVEETLSVRLSAYESILEIFGKTRHVHDLETANLARDVDWEFLSEVEAAAVAAGFKPRLPGVKELEAIEAETPAWDWSAQGETIRLLEEGSASEKVLLSILEAIPTKSRLPHFRPHLERLLRHPSPMIRRQALRVLGLAWMEGDLVPAFLEMLRNDPDESVRSVAAFSIGVIRRDSKDRALLGDLATLLPDCPDDLRLFVYDSLLSVAGRQTKSSAIEEPSRPVIDWKLVESFARQED